MSDIMLFQGPDGGDVEVVGGVLTLDASTFTALYLSLWGGNVEDDGTPGKIARQWWANADEAIAARRYRSKTQAILLGLPAIPANMQRVVEAVEADLAWLKPAYATNVVASVTIPARNRAAILVKIQGPAGETAYRFDRPWGPSR